MTPTSIHHPLLKEIRRAAASGRPTPDGLIVAEGAHLLEEALSGSWAIERILVTPAGAERYRPLLDRCSANVITIPGKTFSQIASTESAQEVLCLLRWSVFDWSAVLPPRPLVVVLDALQDPGNAGTIVRSAEAFGATGIVLLEGCVRTSNTKFLRAAAGSLFRLPFLEQLDPAEVVKHLKAAGVTLYILDARSGRSVRSVNLRLPAALVVGNEGAGVSSLLAASGIPVAIPTGRVESLNAGVACALALYEAHNQRVFEVSPVE